MRKAVENGVNLVGITMGGIVLGFFGGMWLPSVVPVDGLTCFVYGPLVGGLGGLIGGVIWLPMRLPDRDQR